MPSIGGAGGHTRGSAWVRRGSRRAADARAAVSRKASSPEGRNGSAIAWPSSSDAAAHSSPADLGDDDDAVRRAAGVQLGQLRERAGLVRARVADGDARGGGRDRLHRPHQVLEGGDGSHESHFRPETTPLHQAYGAPSKTAPLTWLDSGLSRRSDSREETLCGLSQGTDPTTRSAQSQAAGASSRAAQAVFSASSTPRRAGRRTRRSGGRARRTARRGCRARAAVRSSPRTSAA